MRQIVVHYVFPAAQFVNGTPPRHTKMHVEQRNGRVDYLGHVL